MKKALYLSKQIAQKKTLNGKRKAILLWCVEVKKYLSIPVANKSSLDK
jgi:hypothetical protein